MSKGKPAEPISAFQRRIRANLQCCRMAVKGLHIQHLLRKILPTSPECSYPICSSLKSKKTAHFLNFYLTQRLSGGSCNLHLYLQWSMTWGFWTRLRALCAQAPQRKSRQKVLRTQQVASQFPLKFNIKHVSDCFVGHG